MTFQPDVRVRGGVCVHVAHVFREHPFERIVLGTPAIPWQGDRCKPAPMRIHDGA